MRLENRRLLLNASFFGSLLLPIAAFGQVSCLALNTHPDVAFHPHVSEFTAALMPTTNPNRCEVEFTCSSEGGPEAGYGRDGYGLGLPDTRSEGTSQSGEAPPADHRVEDPEAARGPAGER